MESKIYKIGTYRDGQQFAKEVFSSNDLNEVKQEFIRIFENTDFDPEGIDNEPESSEVAWAWKHFSEDVNNIAVFECYNEDDLCITNYCNQGFTTNMLK